MHSGVWGFGVPGFVCLLIAWVYYRQWRGYRRSAPASLPIMARYSFISGLLLLSAAGCYLSGIKWGWVLAVLVPLYNAGEALRDYWRPPRLGRLRVDQFDREMAQAVRGNLFVAVAWLLLGGFMLYMFTH